MQLLEGPRPAVELSYSHIERDNRHTDINFHFLTLVSNRLFPAWAMRDAPTSPWMWTPEDVAADAVNAASYEDFLNLYVRLAVELKAARRTLTDLAYLTAEDQR